MSAIANNASDTNNISIWRHHEVRGSKAMHNGQVLCVAAAGRRISYGQDRAVNHPLSDHGAGIFADGVFFVF